MKKVFLSFAPEDIQKVKNLLSCLASQDYDLDFCDGQLDIDFDSKEADSIRREIGGKIAKSNITVCLVSEAACKSKWVDCQLNKSRNKGNRIIVMALKGTENAVLPDIVKEENLTFYPFSPEKLKKLILENR
jgi:hypothetical protein